MRAIVFERYGRPEVMELREVLKPVPGDNEVLIRIHATVATPPDCAFRSANPFIVRFFTGLLRPKFPIIGTTLAGEIEAVGAAVTRFRPGDRVYGASDLEFGAYADYKCLPETGSLALMPGTMGHGEAAALSEGFLTALPFLRDEARLQPGQTLLVNGASGSIGTTAVQLAKQMGAIVTGVCSTRNVELVRSLGADRVIDYTKEDFTAASEAYDVIFDAVGKSSFVGCKQALKPTGIYMTTVPSFAIAWHTLTTRNGKGRRGILATTGLRSVEAKTRDLEMLTGLVEEGTLRAVVDRTYPLERMVEAHRYVETGRKRGSVVIDTAA